MSRIQKIGQNQQKCFAFYSPKGSQCYYQEANIQPIFNQKVTKNSNSFIVKTSHDAGFSRKIQKQCNISTPTINTERKQSIQKALAHYAQQNKKLIKERSSLFKKNCQLSKRIKNLEMCEQPDDFEAYICHKNYNSDQNEYCKQYDGMRACHAQVSPIKIPEHKKLVKLLSPTQQNCKYLLKTPYSPRSTVPSLYAPCKRNNEENFLNEINCSQKQLSPIVNFANNCSPRNKINLPKNNTSQKKMKPFSIKNNNLSHQLIQRCPEKVASPPKFQYFAKKKQENFCTNFSRAASPKTSTNICSQWKTQSQNISKQFCETKSTFNNLPDRSQQSLNDKMLQLSKKHSLQETRSIKSNIFISHSNTSSQLNYSRKNENNRSKQIHNNVQGNYHNQQAENNHWNEYESRKLSLTSQGKSQVPSGLRENFAKQGNKKFNIQDKLKKIRQQNYRLRQQLKI